MATHKKLNKQPLKFALAEFRFSPVIKMPEFIPELQEALRRKYPILKNDKEQVVLFQAGGIGMNSIDRWSFISASKKTAVEINQERLVFVTAEYNRFPQFSDDCRFAISLLEKIVEPGLIGRIGLRYSDLINISKGEKVSDLVDPHLGYFDCLSPLGQAKRKTTETFLHTKIGGLVVRTLYGEHNMICLPDANQLPISLGTPGEPSERIILDFDHFWEAEDESVTFEVEDVLDKLAQLHDISIDAFWNITSENARDKIWA